MTKRRPAHDPLPDLATSLSGFGVKEITVVPADFTADPKTLLIHTPEDVTLLVTFQETSQATASRDEAVRAAVLGANLKGLKPAPEGEGEEA